MSDENKLGLDSLIVWQNSMNFAVEICRNLLPKLPVEEKFVLSQQLRRSVQSIPTNIAEGYGRYYYQEGIRFCYIARGSVEEVYTQLHLCSRLNYINEPLFDQYTAKLNEIRRQINGYISYLRRSKRGEAEAGGNYHVRESKHWEENDIFLDSFSDHESNMDDEATGYKPDYQ